MTRGKRIFLTSVTVLSVLVAVVVYVRTRPIDVTTAPLPSPPEQNSYQDYLQLADETIRLTEKSFVLREGLRLIPDRGSEQLHDDFRVQMAPIRSKLLQLAEKSYMPETRWAYSGESFPHEAARYWTKANVLEIKIALAQKNYARAANELYFTVSLLQRLRSYADVGISSVMNLRSSHAVKIVANDLANIPDQEAVHFFDVMNRIEAELPDPQHMIDAEEWGQIELYREFQSHNGSTFAGAYLDFRAVARHVKKYFDELRRELNKPVLKRIKPEAVVGPLAITDVTDLKVGVDPGYNDLLTCRLRVVAAAFAIKAHRAASGSLPKSLSEAYKRLDPFTGNPLIYKVLEDGFQVYSPGYDGDDDGGLPGRLLERDGDITTVMGGSRGQADRPVRIP